MLEKKNKLNRSTELSADESAANSPASLILQWLTYAFWGWCGIAMIWLSIVVSEYFIMGGERSWSSADAIAYPVAAVIVLLLIAATIDWLYAKVEPARKLGAAMVIMVIHAVLFALATIGALITSVFSLVNMSLQTGRESTPAQVFLLAAILCMVVFGALTARTILAGSVRNLRKIMWGLLSVIIGGTLLAAFFGPLTYASFTKQDRLIERGLPGIVNEISDFTSRESKLPESLENVTLNDPVAQQLLDDKLVTFKPNTKPVEKSTETTKEAFAGVDLHYYQLCVMFKAEHKDNYSYANSGYTGEDKDGYSSYLYSISDHPKGYYCYKLIATGPYDGAGTPSPMPLKEDAITAF